MKKQYLFLIALSFNIINTRTQKDNINSLINAGIKNYENQNLSEAEYFLSKAYKKNENWKAGFYLGMIYSSNKGFPFIKQNDALALKYFSKATKDLSSLIFKENAQVDINLAISLLLEAVRINYTPAKYALANLYIKQKNYNKSILLLKDLILNSNNTKYIKASNDLLKFLGNKNITEALYVLLSITSEPIDKNTSRKNIWLKKLEEKTKTSNNAKLYLAEYWEQQNDYRKASYWLEQASEAFPNKVIKKLEELKENGVVDAIFVLGKIYMKQNKPNKAKIYFRIAKDLGCPLAKFHLAKINIQLSSNNTNT